MNKYLEKAAGVRLGNAKRIGSDALGFAKKHPLPTLFGIDGAAEGAAGTTHKGNENYSRTALRAVSNTISGATSGIATGTVLEYGHKYLLNQRNEAKALKTAANVGNKFVEKVASLQSLKEAGREAWRVTKANPATVGLGVVGGLDGLAQTTHQKDEPYLKTGLRAVRNTLTGVTAGAFAGKAIETGYRHLKGKG